MKCHRCGKTGHLKAACYATFDAAGKELESEKPAPVPDAVKRRRAASKKQREKADKGEANAVAAVPTDPENGGFFLKITKNNKGGAANVTEGVSTGPPPPLWETKLGKLLGEEPPPTHTVSTAMDEAKKPGYIKGLMLTAVRPAKMLTALCAVPTALTLGKNLKGVWRILFTMSILMLLISLIGSELMTDTAATVLTESINPPAHPSSISVTKGTNNSTRKVLVDSGANIMLAPNDNNMTNIRRSKFKL